MIGGLVLAAGGGRRFGGLKQLADLGGCPMLEHVLATMAAAPLDRVVVVLGHEAGAVREAVDLSGAEVAVCERWAEGQSASLRAGAEALAGCEAIVVALGDQPFVSARAVERVLEARERSADAVRATYDGMPGHPVVLERSLLQRIGGLEGDTGARALLDTARVVDVSCDGCGAPDDIDTRGQLETAAGHARRGASNSAEEAVRG